jgi:hypothetical protein
MLKLHYVNIWSVHFIVSLTRDLSLALHPIGSLNPPGYSGIFPLQFNLAYFVREFHAAVIPEGCRLPRQ